MPHVLPVLRAVVDLVAPRRCAGCDLELEPDEEGFCAGCAVLIEPAPDDLRPPAARAAACEYGGPLADALKRLKYERRTELAPVLGRLLAVAAAPLAGRVDEVVPVPLHPRRLARRGFNQAALLARPVARGLGVPCRVGRLRRTRDTAPQVGLSSEARADNVRAAFAGVGRRVGRRVLLIDDVRTTGATLGAAAEALRKVGVDEVRMLTLAVQIGD